MLDPRHSDLGGTLGHFVSGQKHEKVSQNSRVGQLDTHVRHEYASPCKPRFLASDILHIIFPKFNLRIQDYIQKQDIQSTSEFLTTEWNHVLVGLIMLNVSVEIVLLTLVLVELYFFNI